MKCKSISTYKRRTIVLEWEPCDHFFFFFCVFRNLFEMRTFFCSNLPPLSVKTFSQFKKHVIKFYGFYFFIMSSHTIYHYCWNFVSDCFDVTSNTVQPIGSVWCIMKLELFELSTGDIQMIPISHIILV